MIELLGTSRKRGWGHYLSELQILPSHHTDIALSLPIKAVQKKIQQAAQVLGFFFVGLLGFFEIFCFGHKPSSEAEPHWTTECYSALMGIA